MKWYWKLVTLLGFLLVIGLGYETISGFITRNMYNATIARYRANEERLRKEITTASDRIQSLKDTIIESQRKNSELKTELENSTKLANQLRANNKQLNKSIKNSLITTEGIGKLTEDIGATIDRSEVIIKDLLGSE